jgi:hypothetical protein
MAGPNEEELENKTPVDGGTPAESNTEQDDLRPTEDNEAPAPKELLDMSDEDFEKLEATPVKEVVAEEDPATPAKKAEERKTPAQRETKPAGTESGGKKDQPAAAAVDVTPEGKAQVYDTLFGSFKANGRDMKVDTPEEALRLMQMGAGHLKYQARVRPALQIEQTLKNNKIDQDKLNFLIECANGKPEAIKKLVRDAKIEPFDIDTTEESRQADAKYRPTNHVVSESDIALTEKIDTIQRVPNGDAILRVVRSEWDDKSRTRIVEDPEILSVLVAHKNHGWYDRITSEVERRRTLGTLANNMPWLDAYYQVGLDLEKSGAISSGAETTSSPGSGNEPKPAESKVIETAAAKRKLPAGGDPSGVAPVTRTPVVPVKIDASVMDMSDAEFEKLQSKFG